MIRFLKTLLIWILVLALPAQAMASAVKLSCGPAHYNAVQVVHAADGHHHDGATAHSGMDSASSDATASADNSPTKPNIHKSSFCSTCAACCVGATAPPSISFLTPAYSSSELVVISPAPLVTGFIPAGLERPPKRNFA
jgi:hypothetical protein